MLSDSEQRTLTEIERGLRSDDPGFVDRFGAGLPSRPDEGRGTTGHGWLVAAALMMVLAMVLASGVMAVVALAAAGVGAGLWLTRGDADDHRPPWRPR